jgi:hypothetical protein
MFNINRDKFFNILTDLNKSCKYNDIKDKYFMEVPKFNNLMNYIDLNKYTLDYMQNRLIAIKRKDVPANYIKNLILCPMYTKNRLDPEECENITFTFPTEKRNSYLTDTNKDETNESYCVKGLLNPGILNAILVYMLNTNLISYDTMIIFKITDSNSDVIEYLQKNSSLDAFNNELINIININYTENKSGFYNKGFMGQVFIEGNNPSSVNEIVKKAYEIESFDFKYHDNFEVMHKSLPKLMDGNRKLLTYFNASVYIDDRLFIFSDKSKSIKFSVLVEDTFLVEWNTIEKFINQLYCIIKGDEL